MQLPAGAGGPGLRAEVLSDRALGRATLARQMLLDRVAVPVLDAVEHLVGLQAQEPPDPYLALWSRLQGFRPETLAALLLERRVVRIALMRSTIHLVSAEDCLVLRPVMQPVIDAEHEQRPPRRPGPVGRGDQGRHGITSAGDGDGDRAGRVAVEPAVEHRRRLADQGV